MGFLNSGKELQFGTCIYDKPHSSSVKLQIGNSFIEEKGKLRGADINKKSIGGNCEFQV